MYILLSRVYGIETKNQNIRKIARQDPGIPGKRKVKSRIYLMMLTILFMLFALSSVASILILPGNLVKSGIASQFMIFFVVFNAAAVVTGIFLVYYYRLWRHMKESAQNSYRMTLIKSGRYLTLAVLIISAGLYLMGLNESFSLHRWSLTEIPGLANVPPGVLLIITVVIMLACSAAFVFFILRRSAFSLRQYWIMFIISYVILILYAIIVPGQILDWNTSVLTRSELLSWEYGYTGLILLFLLFLALIYTAGSIIFLRLRGRFVQNGKAKGFSLVHLKMGYICLVLSMLILAFPQLLDIL